MHAYNRNTRVNTHYTLRLLRKQFTAMDWWTLAIALALLILLILCPPKAVAGMGLVVLGIRRRAPLGRFVCPKCGWEGNWWGTRCPRCR